MPWECLSCSSEYTDDLLQCDNASCASPQSKAAWTLHDNATRTFVLKAAQLEVSRGVAAEPSPAANWTLEGQELVETSVARALPKSSVLELFRASRRPAPLDLLFVRAFPASRQKTLEAAVELSAAEPREESFPLQLTGYYERRLVCVYGRDPAGWEEVRFEQLEVLDLSDESDPQGCAESVELEALKRRKELEVERVEADLPQQVCVRLEGMFFELNKAFLLPAAMEGIRVLRRMYEDYPGATILAVGHTDTTGRESRNLSLSLDRARAALAYLSDDVEAWYRHYGKGEDASRRWGFPEDTHMLSALPAGGEPHYGEHHEEHSLLAAVKRFQRAKGLVVDGDPGPNTRRALIADYMALDETSLPEGTPTLAHGCGEHFLAVETEDEQESARNRRVELFIMQGGVQPQPPGETSSAGASEYPAWLEGVDELRTFTPSAAGIGSLLIITDIRSEQVEGSRTEFTLASTDGAYSRTLRAQDGVLDEHGYVDLRFEELPKGSYYTLQAKEPEGDPYTIFDDVQFFALTRQSQALDDDLLHPFGEDPA